LAEALMMCDVGMGTDMPRRRFWSLIHMMDFRMQMGRL
jgi:hypothetical protein